MRNNKKIFFFTIVVACIVNIYSWHLPFFWDTILTSTITQHFYENGFQQFIVPTQLDAGHPPLFYVYVTGFYYLFGKDLFAAHLSILPFTILGTVSFIKILQQYQFENKYQFIGLLLFFAIPAVLTQNCLVSYDAVLLSLYLLALLAILKQKKILFALVLFGIVGVSLRGLFCLASLSITIYFLEKKNVASWMKWQMYFIPAIIIILIWLTYHYTQTGWFISTNAAQWNEQRGFANAFQIFKNGISIARCFFDLGIVIVSLLSLFYLVQKRKLDDYTWLWLIPFLVFSISLLLFKNPINHRYFLIVYVLMLLPVIQFLSSKKIIYAVLTTCILLLGHFQIYPVPISNGWDCTLEHTSYNYVRDDYFGLYARDFYIDRTTIGTVFPMDASRYQTDLLNDTIRMINVNGKSIDSIQYVLYSNACNDFSDEQIEQLKSWKSVIRLKNGLVELILYINPKFYQK